MVLVLVLLPALAHGSGGGVPWARLGTAALELAALVVFMMGVGTRLFPWLLRQAERTGSRELFTLGVLALALGVAFGASQLFGVSLALGAFVAGVVVQESEMGRRAAVEALPFREAFAVLFFVSVGMLFDPSILRREPLRVAAVLAIILVGKSLAALALGIAFRLKPRVALTVAASLAQIGEFSFILAGLGVSLGLLPAEGRSLVLAGAILSIALHPLAFAGVARIGGWIESRPRGLRRPLPR
jgi:K+:H+ antiporter